MSKRFRADHRGVAERGIELTPQRLEYPAIADRRNEVSPERVEPQSTAETSHEVTPNSCNSHKRLSKTADKSESVYMVQETHIARRKRDTKKRSIEPLSQLHHNAIKPIHDADRKDIDDYFREFCSRGRNELPGNYGDIIVKCRQEFRMYAALLIDSLNSEEIDNLVREVFFLNLRIYAKEQNANNEERVLDHIPKVQDATTIKTFGDLEVIRKKSALILDKISCLNSRKRKQEREIPLVACIQAVVLGMYWEPIENNDTAEHNMSTQYKENIAAGAVGREEKVQLADDVDRLPLARNIFPHREEYGTKINVKGGQFNENMVVETEAICTGGQQEKNDRNSDKALERENVGNINGDVQTTVDQHGEQKNQYSSRMGAVPLSEDQLRVCGGAFVLNREPSKQPEEYNFTSGAEPGWSDWQVVSRASKRVRYNDPELNNGLRGVDLINHHAGVPLGSLVPRFQGEQYGYGFGYASGGNYLHNGYMGFQPSSSVPGWLRGQYGYGLGIADRGNFLRNGSSRFHPGTPDLYDNGTRYVYGGKAQANVYADVQTIPRGRAGVREANFGRLGPEDQPYSPGNMLATSRDGGELLREHNNKFSHSYANDRFRHNLVSDSIDRSDGQPIECNESQTVVRDRTEQHEVLVNSPNSLNATDVQERNIQRETAGYEELDGVNSSSKLL